MASDTVLRLTTLPRLMLVMLESDGWRRLERPIDHKIFEHRTIDEWVLGEPWAGLHYPDWATVYALLEKNIEVGQQCIAGLQEAGAPSPTEAERMFRVRAANEGTKLSTTGRPKKGSESLPLPKSSTSAARLTARLKAHHEDVFRALGRGEYPSVRAAAKAAGLVHDKTTFQQLQHWWQKATADEHQAFLEWVNALPGRSTSRAS